MPDGGPEPTDGAMDAAPKSPCAKPSLFCDDFDDVTSSFEARWAVATGAGAFDYDDSTFVSPGRALRLRIPPGATRRASSLTKELDVPTGSFRATFSLRVDLPDTGTFEEIDPVLLQLSPVAAGVKSQTFALAIYANKTDLEAYRESTDGGFQFTSSAAGAPLGTSYHRVVLTVRSAMGTATCTLEIDGSTAATERFPAPVVTKMALSIGAPIAVNVANQPTLRFDDVWVESL